MPVKTQRRAVTRLVAVAVLMAATAAADWNAALAAYRAGQWKTAARELEAVLEKSPGYGPGHYLLGLVRLELGEPAEAVTELRGAVELDPPRAEYSVGLVKALVAAGQPEEALVVAGKLPAEQLSGPQRTLLALLEARAALALKDPGRALPAVRGALEAKPDSPSLHYALGSLLEASGDLEEAFDADRRAFEQDPQGQRASGVRALYLVRVLAGRDATSRSAWYARGLPVARTLADGSKDPDVLQTAGRVALGAGEPRTAATWLAAAVKARPGDPALVYDLGRARAASGDEVGAYTTLASALDMSPAPGLARRIHRQMARIDAHRFNIDGAVEHYSAAGDDAQAEELRATGRGLEEAHGQRKQLVARIRKLESARDRLAKLGDTDGVTATTRQMDGLREDLATIERNIAAAKAALQKL